MRLLLFCGTVKLKSLKRAGGCRCTGDRRPRGPGRGGHAFSTQLFSISFVHDSLSASLSECGKPVRTPSLTSLPLTSHRRRSVGEEGLLQAAALAPVVETGDEYLRTWGTRVRLQIAIVQYRAVFAELRYGPVVHTRENSVKYGPQFRPNPYGDLSVLSLTDCCEKRSPLTLTSQSTVYTLRSCYCLHTCHTLSITHGCHMPPPTRARRAL